MRTVMRKTYCDRCGRLIATDRQSVRPFIWHRRTNDDGESHFDMCGKCDSYLVDAIHTGRNIVDEDFQPVQEQS